MAVGAQVATTSLSRDEQLRGRQNVRFALRGLSKDILVFHNPKLTNEAMDDLYDRPIDIVLVHKTKGILAIAIKCGEIVEESGDLVSQYQPAKQYYKIIDPVKKAQTALHTLMDECDPALKDFVHLSVGVVFPDTHKSEFSNSKPLFFFKESLVPAQMEQDLNALFSESWDDDKAKKYAAHYNAICEFLKNHSDNNIQRVERKETLTKLGIREEKRGYQLPQSTVKQTKTVSPATVAAAQRLAAQKTAEISDLRVTHHNPDKGKRVAAEKKMQQRRKLKAPEALPPIKKFVMTPQQEIQRNSMVSFFKDVEENIKAQERVDLSSSQWGMAMAVGAIVVCIAYFIGRNISIIMNTH
jgi:hypothetical protein